MIGNYYKAVDRKLDADDISILNEKAGVIWDAIISGHTVKVVYKGSMGDVYDSPIVSFTDIIIAFIHPEMGYVFSTISLDPSMLTQTVEVYVAATADDKPKAFSAP